MKSAVTICLVPEARGGPFVYHEGLEHGCSRAAELGFDAVEIFPPSAQAIDPGLLRSLLDTHSLKLAAVGTGAGWLLHQWSLASQDPSIRANAKAFIRSIVDIAGQFGAPAIIGSMQGKIEVGKQREPALQWIAEGIVELAGLAQDAYGVSLLLEPINRYESNVFNRLGDTAQFIRAVGVGNVRILADMFHMNIEETNLAEAILSAGSLIGHVHFADSNRQAIGQGHTDAAAIVGALSDVGYTGYLSSEIFPLPDSESAAKQTIISFRRLVGPI